MGIKLTERPYKAIAGIVVVVVVTTLALWVIRKPDAVPDTPPATIVESIDTADEPETDTGILGEQDEDTESVEAARQIVHVPDDQKKVKSTEHDWTNVEVTFDNLADVRKAVLNAALDGDVDAAFRLRTLRDYCRLGPRDEGTVEKWVDEANKLLDSLGRPVPPEGVIMVGMRLYPDEQRNRAEILKAFRDCERYRDTIESKMRDQLYELAKQGHVMARYLFATWELEPVVDAAAFERHQEWQLQAYDFSYANLVEGEAVGVLAFGRSYYMGLFTRQIPPLGMSLMKAASDCGVDSAHLDESVASYEERSKLSSFHWIFPASREEISALAEHMVSYCR